MKITTNWKQVLEEFKYGNRLLSRALISNNKEQAKNIQFKAKQGARRRAPGVKGSQSRTGAMENAIIILPVSDGKEYRVISKKPLNSRGRGYNIYQEFGISPNPTYGFNPVIGKMQKLDTPWGQHAFAIGLIKGNHPGFKGKHFMEKAFKSATELYPKSVKRMINKTIKTAFKGGK